MATILSIPAGRCARRGETKWVDAQPEKGHIRMKYEDDLLHFAWRNRETRVDEDELIIFPGEATFEKVQQDPSGRTHILRFSSSDQRYFYWFQRADKTTDLRAEVDINALLQDPTYRPGSAPLPERAAPETSAAASSSTPQASSSGQAAAGGSSTAEVERSWPPTPGAPRLSHPEPLPPQSTSTAAAPGASSAATSGGLSGANAQAEMARLLVQWAQSGGLGQAAGAERDDDARLTDVLSPATITSLIQSDSTLGERLRPLLPSGLGISANPSPGDVLPVLTAPQFTDAIASLDNALRSGGLPGAMMRELGLPEEAGRSVRAFLDALAGLKKGEGDGGDERMDTD